MKTWYTLQHEWACKMCGKKRQKWDTKVLSYDHTVWLNLHKCPEYANPQTELVVAKRQWGGGDEEWLLIVMGFLFGVMKMFRIQIVVMVAHHYECTDCTNGNTEKG